jgi:hypothetical protein
MNLASVRAGITHALESINNLRIYEWIPSTIQPPAAVVSLGTGQYDADLDNGMVVNYGVLVMLTRADDQNSQQRLDEFLGQDTDSIYYAIDTNPTLSGSCDSARVTSWNNPGTFTIGGIEYLGVEVNLEVLG